MSANILIGTITGAIIGGITNGIAIKMLFRPLNPVKIGRFTLPFTPGVIPKERVRIASKIGEVISKELLNEEVLRTWLLKEEICREIESSIEDYLKEQLINEKTLYEVLQENIGKERSIYFLCEIEEHVTYKLYSKVVSMELGKIVVEKIQVAFKEGSFGSLLGPMSFLINDGLVESIANKIEPVISKFIMEEGEGIIRKAVEEESQNILDTQVKELVEKVQTYDELIKCTVLNGYKKLVENHLTRILKALDIAQIVEERILSLDMLEIEQIILLIMKKELNAIIWFGVLLGAIMGIFASLF
ncbi:MAG: DUF445 family protein [Candidatus Cellulosilyticum pullistercoris]|uniref:DUF445 family protein n=1 Tax=Candidatus Cellulosilyticum pullistercoris TaxID=2838521 RepID=A0A9E2NM14_9FIRM|nr:DUF445 family protein [Candidatus Cellulosilyticum pullistercoris]